VAVSGCAQAQLQGRSLEPGASPQCSSGKTAGPATRTGVGILTRLVHAPVDIASLAAFRFLFGLLMALAMTRFLAKGWVRELYVGPVFHFTYEGFDWVRPWPGPLMHLHFVLLAGAAMGVAAGFYYRICITIFFLGFTYVELIDQTAYLNHYYLISLLSGLMIFLPANRAWSIDVLRRPGLRLDAVPAWTLNILRFQIGVVFVFAGLAKLNADWLLSAQPLRIWLAARSDLPLLATGRRWKLKNDLTPRQEVMMAQDPYLIRALARWLAKDLQAQGHAHVQIKVNAFATLNGRPSQRLIDSNVDLAGPVSAGWIVALKQ